MIRPTSCAHMGLHQRWIFGLGQNTQEICVVQEEKAGEVQALCLQVVLQALVQTDHILQVD